MLDHIFLIAYLLQYTKKSPSLDKEALRIVSIMPKWKAGKLNGVPVKVKMSFPVIFKLPNDDNALKTDSLIESIEE